MDDNFSKRVRIFLGAGLVFIGILLVGPSSRGATLGEAFAENWILMIGMLIVAGAIAFFVPLSERRKNHDDEAK